eukprot:SAG31_NODE_4399_length_3269_cov_11.372871_2_plen_108_part_00
MLEGAAVQGTLAAACKAIFVNKADPESRITTATRIRTRAQSPEWQATGPVLIFPEATTALQSLTHEDMIFTTPYIEGAFVKGKSRANLQRFSFETPRESFEIEHSAL